MDPDEEFFEASQQLSQDNGEGTGKKKKKKKKSKRNLDEDFANAEDETFEEESQSLTVFTQQSVTQDIEDDEEPTTSTPKKKKKKKKSSKNDEEPSDVEAEATFVAPQTPGPSSKRLSPKKEPVTPAKSSSLASVPKTADTDERTTGINILAAMSHDDLELLLNKVGAECPVNEAKAVKKREMEIDWSKIAFSCYSADHCRLAWTFLQSQTRKYRIMHELVEEVKFNLKTDYHKFMRKSIEGAPNFPKLPYASGAFQYFCKEKWDEHKHLQEKMKKKVENFLTFQTQCHKRWTSLTDEQRLHYEQQAKLLKAEYNQKVREFYANYPAFLTKKELKLDKDGKPEVKERPISDHLRKQFVKTSQECYVDAPKFPSTPMLLYLNSKLNEMEPPPTAAELPSYKKELCEKWKELSNKKKLKWIKKCIKACEHYHIEVAEYKKTHPFYFLSKELQMSKLINKEEFNIWAEYHGKPPKPKNTIFDFFFEEFRRSDEAAGKSEEEVTSLADKKFKELAKHEKDRYTCGYKMQHLNFRQDIEEYMSTVPDMMRACVIDSLPKKYKVLILDKVNKEPLVNDDDLIQDDDEEEGSRSKKRKRNNGEEESSEESKKKRKAAAQDPASLPLYAEDLGDEHKELVEKSLNEIKRRKAVEEEQKANNYSPGKNITPQIINEAIRGIFDGRQFERRFTVYYYYAKYIAREKAWCTLYSKIGVVQTAARMIETFNRLTQQEKQVFLDQALEFHNTLRHYDKQFTKEEEIFAPKLRLFPEEPKPPPRKATLLYKQEAQVLKLKNPDPDHQPPTWDQLDQHSQMLYLKKLYKLHREYIVDYEKFVRNMTPNDMIEYLIRQAHSWNSAAAKGKAHSYFDHNIYSTAVALRTQLTREAYSLEMSEDGQESEPELYSMEDGSLLNGTHKFHYKPNPFSCPKRSRGRPRRKPRSFIDKLCSSSKHNNSDSSSSSSSSSSEGEGDEEITKFGNLVLPDRKKKKMRRFQRKLKKVERYYYPLMDEYYEPFDCLKVFQQASSLRKEDSKREALAQITEHEAKWENVRSIINSKPNLRLVLPKHFGKKAFKKATNKKVTAVKRKAGQSPRKKKKSRVCRKATSTIEKLMMKNAMCLLKDQSYEKKRSRKKQKGLEQQVELDGNGNSDDDEYDDVLEDENEGQTPFIRTAAQIVAETRERNGQDLRPELESLSDTSSRRGLSQSQQAAVARQPGLVLVRRSPSPIKKSFVFKEPNIPVPRKRVSSQSRKDPSPSLVEEPPIIPESPRRSQPSDATDEFQLLDTLADFESGQGIFSESELNQLSDYNL